MCLFESYGKKSERDRHIKSHDLIKKQTEEYIRKAYKCVIFSLISNSIGIFLLLWMLIEAVLVYDPIFPGWGNFLIGVSFIGICWAGVNIKTDIELNKCIREENKRRKNPNQTVEHDQKTSNDEDDDDISSSSVSENSV